MKKKPLKIRRWAVVSLSGRTLAAGDSGNIIGYYRRNSAVMSCGHGYEVRRVEIRVLGKTAK